MANALRKTIDGATDEKTVLRVLKPDKKQWVGDGFHVSTMFSPHTIDHQLTSPFLLLDYAHPCRFEPSTANRGVGAHPHRGFETVTFALQGSIEHRDSAGGGGIIGPGDVQWMTAGSGIIHEELHSKKFKETGGTLEMIQLWVNLPADRKGTQPSYQALKNKDFPRIQISHNMGYAEIISGTYSNHTSEKGPARTHTEISIFFLNIEKSGLLNLPIAPQTNTLILQLNGQSKIAEHNLLNGEMAIISMSSSDISIQSQASSRLLVMNGQPINEPVVAYGPFVMNKKSEIIAAIRDYEEGQMGALVKEENKG